MIEGIPPFHLLSSHIRFLRIVSVSYRCHLLAPNPIETCFSEQSIKSRFMSKFTMFIAPSTELMLSGHWMLKLPRVAAI